jgi:hypothetical protein
MEPANEKTKTKIAPTQCKPMRPRVQCEKTSDGYIKNRSHSLIRLCLTTKDVGRSLTYEY